MVNFITTLSPQRVIMGGGVMQQAQLFALIHRKVQDLLNEYVQAPEILERKDPSTWSFQHFDPAKALDILPLMCYNYL